MVEQSRGGDERASDCLVRAATDVLSHRWDGVILAVLGSGAHRRFELRDAIGQVKDKPLTEALTRLTAANLIVRHHISDATPRSAYELTQLGRTFHDGPLRALASWAQEHGEGLLEEHPRA